MVTAPGKLQAVTIIGDLRAAEKNMPRTTRSAKRHNGASANRRQHEEAPLSQPGASSTDADEEVEMPDAPPQPEPSKPAIDDDDLCPICHLLLFRPVRTTCAHTLCQSCMAHWADVSAASAHMAIVPLTDAEPAPDAHPGFVEARCPMCRTVTSAARDGARERALRRRYPGVWVERQREEDDGGEGVGGDGKVETVTVFLGNTHKLLQDEDGDGNCHEWSFFVRISDTEVVEEVQILLVRCLSSVLPSLFLMFSFWPLPFLCQQGAVFT